MQTETHVVQALNQAFDEERRRRALRNDKELAGHLGLNPKTVSFLRNNRMTQTTRAVATVLVENMLGCTDKPTDAPTAHNERTDHTLAPST